MKVVLSLVFVWLAVMGMAQDTYPVPDKGPHHLFYIQHSDNHNTYVYEANVVDGSLDADEPVKVHRVVYTEGGHREPLNYAQRRYAYGVEVCDHKGGRFELKLAASEKLILHLEDKGKRPRVQVSLDETDFYLDRIYVKLLQGGLKARAEYVIFYGHDRVTGDPVRIRRKV